MAEPKDATAATRAANAAMLAALPPEDGADFERAGRGFIDTLPDARVEVDGRVAWDLSPFAFEQTPDCPDTVNPSLWRQARLNLHHGLFKVTDGVYQVRGFDISNITFIEGETGFVVIDPLTTAEPAAAALALMRRHRGDKPVTAVIYTHSHVDHYGGVLGVLSEADVAAGARIIAPEGFLIEAVSENVLLGNVMNRRATYMYGALLPRGPRGHVDAGLGKAVSLGQPSLVAPTESVSTTGTRLTIDGVEVLFQVTPGTEAPAEMNFFFPKLGALCMAENCTCHLHNLYTPRGAQVRDAKAWSFYIDEAIELFAGETQALFASHHWPRWGPDDARKFLARPARSLQVRPRPDAADGQPRPHAQGDRRGPGAAADPGGAVAHPRLLRHAQPQRQGGLPALPRLVRRQSGQPAPAAADRGRPALRRPGGRTRRAAGQGQDRLRRRRLPLGGRGGEPPGVRRSGQHRSARTAGRRAGADGLPGRIRSLAGVLPHRRPGAAQPDRRLADPAPGGDGPAAASAGELPARTRSACG